MAISSKSDSKITTLDDQADVPSAKVISADIDAIKGENFDAQMSGDTRMLTIHVSNEEGGHDAVFLGHNGFAYQIPRGKPWKVPAEVAQIIADSVMTSYKPGPGGSSIETKTPRFAYSIA